MEAVSYTHLDVYKRQVHIVLIVLRCLHHHIKLRHEYRCESKLIPVSYTHLDVYKRQNISCIWTIASSAVL